MSDLTEESLCEENKRLKSEVEEGLIKKTVSKKFSPEELKNLEEQLNKILSQTAIFTKFLSEKIARSTEKLNVAGPSTQTSCVPSGASTSNRTSSSQEYGTSSRSATPSRRSRSSVPITANEMKSQKRKFPQKGAVAKKIKLETETEKSLLENVVLRDYQLDGVQFLQTLYENGINGILADEMGLGKTVQTIAFLTNLFENNVRGRFLIIAPLSTMATWLDEFAKFAPKVKVLLFHGNREKRLDLQASYQSYKLNGLDTYPIILTTYEVPLLEEKFFQKYNWKYIIVDEGHRLKNYKCQLSIMLKWINSENRLILTGTPLQNNLEELWALLNFLMPEIFDDLAVFEKLFAALAVGNSSSILQEESDSQLIHKIHKLLSPFILRRLKQDVNITLPPKKEVIVYAPMTKLQFDMYSATLREDLEYFQVQTSDNSQVQVCGKQKRKCSIGKKYVFEEFEDMVHEEKENKCQKTVIDEDGNECKLHLTMRTPHIQLLKIASHPYMVRMPLEKGKNQILVDQNLILNSGKFIMLQALLGELKSRGHKVLIFSTWTSLLDMVEEFLLMKQYQYVRLDGSTKLEVRCENIQKFTKDPEIFIFMISTRAGGLGLNLTAADTVIILNSDWNPQADLQAQDRCHRFGQTKPVVVYRFVSESTIDEKVLQLGERKRALERAVLYKDKFKSIKNLQFSYASSIPLEELRNMLKSVNRTEFHSTGGVVSKETLEKLLDRSNIPGTTSSNEFAEIKYSEAQIHD